MKVLVDARGLLEEVRAGVESYTYCLLDHLQRLYPEDEYVLFSYSRTRKPPVDLAKKWKWVHFEWSNILMSVSFRVLNQPQVDTKIGKFDWVWFPNIRFFPVSRDIKKIVTVHDLSFEILPDCYSLKRRLWHWHMNIKKNLQAANQIVCVSENTKNDLLDNYQLSGNKIRTIYPGLTQVKGQNNNYSKDGYIVYLGTLEDRKNILGLLRGYSYYAFRLATKPMKLVLVGGVSLTWDIEDYLKKNNLRDLVKIAGFVDEEEKGRILSSASLVIYPSFYEGFGFPPLEGLQRDKLVMSSFGGSLGEVTGDWGLLFDALDWKGIGINIWQILRAKKKIMNSQTGEIAEKFDWSKAARAFRELLEK